MRRTANTRKPRLRRPRPGELGWVVSRHGSLYEAEYGWDARFEGLVAGIVAEFVKNFDPARERCWIADLGGEPVGSVFLVNAGKGTAKLRMLLVEPRARGMGIGRRLVAACLRFARQAGYRKVALWTNSTLHAARRIYEGVGFRMVNEERDAMLGGMSQTWELAIPASTTSKRARRN